MKFLSLLLIVVFVAIVATPSFAAPPQPPENVYAVPLKMPLKGTLKEEVNRGIQLAKNGDFSVLYPLCDKSPEALSYVKQYASHPNDNVRYGVAILASCVGGQEGIPILSSIVARGGNGARNAITGLFRVASVTELQKWGGEKLKTKLLRYLKSVPTDSEALFLLSAVGRDASTKSLLKKNLDNSSSTTMIVTGDESPIVPLAFASGVVLSELNDSTSIETLDTNWATAPVDKALYPLHAIGFINNKTFLKSLTGLLDNDNTIKTIPQANEEPIVIRVKDAAYQALSHKLGIVSHLRLYPYRPIDQAQIENFKIAWAKFTG